MKKTLLLICLAAVIIKLPAQSLKLDVNFGQNLSTISETESAQGKAIPKSLMPFFLNAISNQGMNFLLKKLGISLRFKFILSIIVV